MNFLKAILKYVNSVDGPHMPMYTYKHALDEKTMSQQRRLLLSPNSLISIAGALCEPALICELNMTPQASLIVIVFSGKCQLSFSLFH